MYVAYFNRITQQKCNRKEFEYFEKNEIKDKFWKYDADWVFDLESTKVVKDKRVNEYQS